VFGQSTDAEHGLSPDKIVLVNPKTAALVLIDLQKGILSRALAPHSGADVYARAMTLAQRFREASALVVRVKVEWSRDYADAPPNEVDEPMPRPASGYPKEWSEFPDDPLALGDLVVVKRQWGAFHGTELHLQLQRRGIETIVLAGIATNFGVESTARHAWELNYRVLIVEDATTSMSQEMHDFSIAKVLPRIARIVKADTLQLQ
jgi:nicotinamidase-related amidase